MFWETFILTLLYAWIIRYILGAAYGIYLMSKTHPSTWDWQTQLLVGLPFWIAYYIVTGMRRIVRWRCRKKELAK